MNRTDLKTMRGRVWKGDMMGGAWLEGSAGDESEREQSRERKGERNTMPESESE